MGPWGLGGEDGSSFSDRNTREVGLHSAQALLVLPAQQYTETQHVPGMGESGPGWSRPLLVPVGAPARTALARRPSLSKGTAVMRRPLGDEAEERRR